MSDTELTYEEIMIALEQAETTDLADELERRGLYISDEDNPPIDEADDSVLIDELKSRGYTVGREPEIIPIEDYWNQGNRKEALFLLERQFPELIGISKLIV